MQSYFVGGMQSDFNTSERVRAFRDVISPDAGDVDICGYGADEAEAALRSRVDVKGRLPDVLFVNSTIAFEGIFRFLKSLPDSDLNKVAVGCYDWDPFLAHLHFPVAMVRQDAEAMIKRAYDIIDSHSQIETGIELIPPILEFGTA
jgi:LacI family transcriptional regulator, fructose operon transcriptional repressor